MGIKLVLYVQKIENGEILIKNDYKKLKSSSFELPKSQYKYLVSKDDPSLGDPSARVHIVEFSDFQCPYCKASVPAIQQIVREYKNKIHFVYRDFPLPTHPYAHLAAEAAECAQDQGRFWEMHDALFADQKNINNSNLLGFANKAGLDIAKFNKCFKNGQYKDEVEQDFKTGQLAGVKGTPTFFINENLISGLVSYQQLKIIIDQELERTFQNK